MKDLVCIIDDIEDIRDIISELLEEHYECDCKQFDSLDSFLNYFDFVGNQKPDLVISAMSHSIPETEGLIILRKPIVLKHFKGKLDKYLVKCV